MFTDATSVIINNKEVQSIITSDGGVIYEKSGFKPTPILTLTGADTPYLENLVLSGTINIGSGYSIKIYQDDVLIDTITSGTDGAFSKTITGLSIGSYEFQAVFEGDSDYNPSSSSELEINIVKITPTISITGSDAYYGSDVYLTGTLSVGSGESVKIYQGDTLIDTVTTESGGAFAKNMQGLNAGSYVFKAVYEGDSTYASVTSSNLNISVFKLNSSLTIDVPLSLVYSDEFNISGILKDSYDNLLAGQTVKLKVGSTVVDTQTTDASGVATFTQTPVHMGTHSFQLVYEASTNYNGVNSSTVSREIGKETSVINLTAPTNNGEIWFDGSVSISGSLLSDDAEAISGASILVQESGATLTTLTTDSNGDFTGSLPGLSIGTHVLAFVFETTAYYTATNISRTVIVKPPTLTLTSDKSALSYKDSESATLTAHLAKGATGVSGETITIVADAPLGTQTYQGQGVSFPIYDVYDLTLSASGSGEYVNYNNMVYIENNGSAYVIKVRIGDSPLFDSYVINGDTVHWNGKSLSYYDSNNTLQTLDLSSYNIGHVSNLKTVTISTYSTTAVTDSNGDATVTYASHGIGDVEFYAQWGSVLSEVYAINDRIFLDECSSSTKLTHYGIPITVMGSSATIVLSYNSSENAYFYDVTSNRAGDLGVTPITPSIDQDNYKITVKYKHSSTANTVQPSLWFYDNSSQSPTVYGGRHLGNGTLDFYQFDSSSFVEITPRWSPNSYSTGISSQYFKMIVEKQGKSYTWKLEDSNGTTVSNGAFTLLVDCNTVGLGIYPYEGARGYYIKEISIDSL